eukprot:6938506-Prymnesium_polylepis.1
MEAQPARLPKFVLVVEYAEQFDLYHSLLPVVFPRSQPPFAVQRPPASKPASFTQPATAASGAGVGVASAAAAGIAASSAPPDACEPPPRAPPPPEVSVLGGAADDLSGDRFALSRAALGIGSGSDLEALVADIRAARVSSLVGRDRAGRPTLMVDIGACIPFITPGERDRLVLALQQEIEPVASASGEEGCERARRFVRPNTHPRAGIGMGRPAGARGGCLSGRHRWEHRTTAPPLLCQSCD